MVLRKIWLRLFLVLFTLFMAGYAFLVFVLPRQVLDDLHAHVPWIELISSFLWSIDPYSYYDPTQKTMHKMLLEDTSTRSVAEKNWIFAERVEDDIGNWFSLVDLPRNGQLYAPVFTFAGEVSSWATAVRLLFTHAWRHVSKEFLLDDFMIWDSVFSFTVWLHRDSLFAGKNSYFLEVIYASGEVLSKRIDLEVTYERLVVWDQTIFIDPHLIPDDAKEDIVWTAKDLQENETYFITYGCDPLDNKPPVLVRDIVDYKVIPACLSFSLAKGYVLFFTYRSTIDGELMYAADRWSLGVVSEHIPLYYDYFWRMFYSLVFYDPLTDHLSTLRVWGDTEKHDIELSVTHIPTNSLDLQITLYWGTQMQIVTRTEKLIFYLYKERDPKNNLIHPGTRFQYFRKSLGDRWHKVEEWQAYSLPIRIVAPGKWTKPTYTLDFQTNGTDIVITDGVRRLDLKKTALRTSLQSTQLTTQYTDCDRVIFGAYGNLFGEQYPTYNVRNPLLLLASWLPESGVTLSYNDEPQQFVPDQLFGWYLYHTLRYPNKWLQKWVNTYRLHIKNARNNDMCTKQIDILIE